MSPFQGFMGVGMMRPSDYSNNVPHIYYAVQEGIYLTLLEIFSPPIVCITYKICGTLIL
jgi:hypothetical protein